MASTISLFVLCQLVLLQGAFAIRTPVNERIQKPANGRRAIAIPPSNTAVLVGVQAILECEASNDTIRIQWYEYASGNPNGEMISDNEFTMPGHPNYGRYEIIHTTETQYNLNVLSTLLDDGGKYECYDVTTDTFRDAQLIILASDPVCTSTVPTNGVVIKNQNYHVDCTINYQGSAAPFMSWTGPPPFTPYYMAGDVNAFSSALFTASPAMTGFRYACLTNFTDGGFSGNNSAQNAPDYSYIFNDTRLILAWAPEELYYNPLQPSYTVGDALTCYADARPTANFTWKNMRTQVETPGTVLLLTDDDVGSTLFRCAAENFINGAAYSDFLYGNITVTPKPTTGAPTTPRTTPRPLPWDICDDLTGQWTAYYPASSFMCLEIDNNNQGALVGVLKNGTDQIYVAIGGRTAPDKTDQVGFTGIWPNHAGTSSFAGICTKCYGEEELRVAAVSRSIEHSPDCAVSGAVRYTDDYVFYRTGGPCRREDMDNWLKIGREAK